MPTHKISSPGSNLPHITIAQIIVAILAAGCASSPPPAIEPPSAAAPAPESATTTAQPAAAQQTEAPAPEVDTAASEAADHAMECGTAEDCSRRSDVPAGAKWVCESGSCSAKAAAEPVKAEPSPVVKKGKKAPKTK